MERRWDIVEFSRDLYVHNSNVFMAPEDRESLNPTAFIYTVSQMLNVFRDAFCVKLHKLYRNHIADVLDTEEEFLIYTIPRCLVLFDDGHYYFSFMLVAAFIQELVYYLESKRKCYRFVGSAYKCLVSVFRRRFEDNFEEEGGWRGLLIFCQSYEYWNRLNPREYKQLSHYLTHGSLAHCKYVYELIKRCDIVQNEQFVLKDCEWSLIEIDDEQSLQNEINDSISGSEDSQLQVEQETLEENATANQVAVENLQNSDSASSSSAGSWHSAHELLPDSESLTDSNGSIESDSDSNSEQNMEVRLRLKYPKEFGKTVSELTCKWCNKMCYEYAKYFFRLHRDMSLRPVE